jgi:hypothetical protein
MRALELFESVVCKARGLTAAQLASLALVAMACGEVDPRAFTDDDPPAFNAGGGGASSGNAGPSGVAGAVGAPPPSGSGNAAAGSQGVAGSPGSGSGNPGSATPGSSNPGGGGSSNVDSVTPVSASPVPANGGSSGSGGSANAGSAGSSAEAGVAGAGAPAVVAAPGPCALRLLVNTPTSFDDAIAVMANEITAFAVADRPFIRYVTLTNRQNAGAPDCELDADRRLLVDVLDSFVVDDTRRPAAPVAAGSMVMYRIDLRAYGWDVGVALRGLQFISTWEAMVNFSPYSTEFRGESANTLLLATNTTVPFLFASALIEQVLAGVPPLGADVLANLQQDPALAAALGRVVAPVEIPDVAGDFSISRMALSGVLRELDPVFLTLAGGGFLDRAEYAPLFLPSLCILTEGQPSELVTCSR